MRIENPGPRLSQEALAKFELQVKLPADYRDFLLRHNGGAPSPNTIDVPNAPGSPTDVQVFFGIGRCEESSELGWNLTMIKDRCPSYRVVPIACDSGGSLFCLTQSGPLPSTVVYCDLDDPASALYPVAPSFSEFLRLLRNFEH
jgi:hypothetical protein